ncbi:MAG: phytanoyl-CoA dioxygenase family protein [Pseudomonadales bacterium]|nr:phytanoyl-CoA dioxygenase family protein [Pseudomonadales bacterium]
MITLPHHCEFLSDAWLAEARGFLDRELAGRRSQFAGRAFSLSERYTDAPPHMSFPNDVAAWSVRYDGAQVAVGRDFDAAAERVVEGDYQAALTVAQRVGALSSDAMAAARADVRHLFGPDARRECGAHAHPAAAELLGLLHDHMARRTVENPDLAHRATRLGIADRVREMEESGYTVIERAITPAFADEIREATLRALLPHHPVQLQWMLYHGQSFERIVQNPQLMTLIDASLGRGAVIASLSAIRRGPGPGFIPIHTDYSMVPEPYPEFAMTGVGVWALEDWTVASGPTWIVPGSHRMRRGPRKGEGLDRGVPIEMPKGSVVYFTHGVWHWQGDRTEPGERVTLHAHFNRGILRGLEPKKIDVQMMHRNAPRLGEMLGEDDWFDKLTANGRDHVRAAYMMRLHQFTEERKRVLLGESALPDRAAR